MWWISSSLSQCSGGSEEAELDGAFVAELAGFSPLRSHR
jgi:hypothetical protein